MGIAAGQLAWYYVNGTQIPDNSLHAVMGAGRIGDGDTTAIIYLRNTHGSFTLTGVKLWTVQDSGGGAFSVALAADPHFPGLTPTLAPGIFTSAMDKAGGLDVPDIPPGQQIAVAVRRNLVGAGTAYPENNRVVLSGTSPI